MCTGHVPRLDTTNLRITHATMVLQLGFVFPMRKKVYFGACFVMVSTALRVKCEKIAISCHFIATKLSLKHNWREVGGESLESINLGQSLGGYMCARAYFIASHRLCARCDLPHHSLVAPARALGAHCLTSVIGSLGAQRVCRCYDFGCRRGAHFGRHC